METLNNELQYHLNSTQLKGIKSIIKANIEKEAEKIVELVKEYTNVINNVTYVGYFLSDKKPYILIQTRDTSYFIKLFKHKKTPPLNLV